MSIFELSGVTASFGNLSKTNIKISADLGSLYNVITVTVMDQPAHNLNISIFCDYKHTEHGNGLQRKN